MSNQKLNIDDPKDARIFLKEAMNDLVKQMTGSELTVLHLADGTEKNINDLTDSEAVQYAYELLPMYKNAYPDLVKETFIQ